MAKAPTQHNRATIGKTSKHKAPHRHRADDKRRGSARERGYSSEWDKFSKAFRATNPLCEYCLVYGRITPATVTDHDIPHQGDPDLFWDNTFTALCAKHHNGEKASAEARYSGDDLLRWVAKRKGR